MASSFTKQQTQKSQIPDEDNEWETESVKQAYKNSPWLKMANSHIPMTEGFNDTWMRGSYHHSKQYYKDYIKTVNAKTWQKR